MLTIEKAQNAIWQCYEAAKVSNLLRFQYSQDTNYSPVKTWLTVEYRENLGASSEDGVKWSILCAQYIDDYENEYDLINRINLMLAETLRSSQQDVNILLKEQRTK